MSSILAIDIGSTKICTFSADYNDEKLTITGIGIAKATGIRKGTIINIESASKAIKKSVDDAIRVSGTLLNRAIISVSGAYTKSIKSFGVVNIPSKEIGIKEINRAIQTALYQANIPNEYEVLHILPYSFKVDEQSDIQDPAGMSGSRLEVNINIIAIQKSTIDNLKRTVQLAGIEIESIVLSAYASSIAVLKDDEKELGVCLIDIGGSTSNIVMHIGNAIRYNDYLSVGGSHITSDLSMALHTPIDIAERVKIEFGSLKPLDEEQIIEIPITGNEEQTQDASLDVVSNIMYARVEETLKLLAKKIEDSGLKDELGAGVVLTGGSTKIDGLSEIAGAIFGNMPVRVAKPINIDGIIDSLQNPIYSTVIGLIKYGIGDHTLYEINYNQKLLTKDNNELENKSINKNSSQTLEQSSEKDENIADIILDKQEPKNISVFQKLWNWLTQIF